jgi:hypothetical protein
VVAPSTSVSLPSLDVVHELAGHGVVVLEERALRRIIKLHHKLPGIGLQVPHTSCLALTRDALAKVADADDVDTKLLPDRVVLVAADRAAIVKGEAATLSALWRAVFHARIHEAFDALALSTAAIRTRVRRIGQTELSEIRHVLMQENQLLPPVDNTALPSGSAASPGHARLVDDTGVYIELVATYLELRYFAPQAIERTFPAAADRRDELDAVIAEDIDAEALLAAARPPGAPAQPLIATPPEEPSIQPTAVVPSAAKAASAARAKGNRARAAILAARAGDVASARIDLDELVARLAKDLGTTATAGWADALLLVARAAGASRDPATRLLYDLQAACIVAEREVKAVDVIGWALSRGKRPVVRPLPATRDLELVRRIKKAVNKVTAVPLSSGDDRAQLAEVMHEISAAGDEHLRNVYRPIIVQAIHAVGLEPHSIPDRVAEKTLVDELLDRAVTVGRLTLGDLRDALSRNDLKLPDLAASDLRGGDPLLRADVILASTLDGVYRRGEMYMRWLQRISSVLFGTTVGRFLTLYVLLPLLGSFAVVEGLQHMLHPFAHKLGYTVHISSRTTLLAGAGVLFLLLHVRPLRTALWFALSWIWRAFKFVVWDVPRWIWLHPLTRAVMRSIVFRWLVRPALPSYLAWHFAARLGVWRWALAGGIFVAAALISNTRFVRRFEELVVDWLVRSGRQLGKTIPGLVKLTLQVFAKLVELLERGLYRVDEWLRFRKGESSILIPLKGFVGTIWFFITYVLRLYVNLFVEPTINPIKHFPVVTVAAKILLPFIPSMISTITDIAKPLMGSGAAKGFAGFTVLVLPGLAGFLVWEFKENWRLYRATRARILQPLVVGHHGESVARLLRPGFHSGTIPKLFTKLRRAAWRDDEAAVARAKEGLHHVEEAVTKFALRQFASLLAAVPAFLAGDVAVSHVHIASNRIDIVLTCPSIDPAPTTLRIELAGRWLVASIPTRGWFAKVTDPHRKKILEMALAGFYKLAAIDIVREQIEHALRSHGGTPLAFDVGEDGLVVFPRANYETEVVYNLTSHRLKRSVRGELLEGETPALAGKQVQFGKQPVYWSVWSTSWRRLEHGEEPMTVISGPSLLPA